MLNKVCIVTLSNTHTQTHISTYILPKNNRRLGHETLIGYFLSVDKRTATTSYIYQKIKGKSDRMVQKKE